MKRWILAAAMAVSTAGCGLLVLGEPVTVQPHPTDPALVIAQSRASDTASNMDSEERRRFFVTQALAAQCGTPTIEDTRVTVVGTAMPTGAPHRLYTMTVRCPNGAARRVGG